VRDDAAGSFSSIHQRSAVISAVYIGRQADLTRAHGDVTVPVRSSISDYTQLTCDGRLLPVFIIAAAAAAIAYQSWSADVSVHLDWINKYAVDRQTLS